MKRGVAQYLGTGLAALALLAMGGRADAVTQSLLERALDGPLNNAAGIVFCSRLAYDDPHWYANIGYYCENENAKAYPGNGAPDVARLYRWDPKTRQLATLLDAQGGCVRDPQVHYDGKKILFSYRKAGSEYFNLYEIDSDGSGLRQITSGAFDDYEPCYLPEGGILFVSTRCQRWVNCWKTQVGTLHRCDDNGDDIHSVSANTEHDNTPWILPDGRVLYTRWEYVDRSQVEYHHLWTMNPDGTGQSVFYGNMHSHIVMIDAKPVPGSDKVLASFSPGHGVNEHAGIATLVTSVNGPDARDSGRPLHKGRLVKDPYPLSEQLFLAARDNQIVLMDDAGGCEVLFELQGKGGLHEPRPLQPRPRERVMPPVANRSAATGRMVLGDVYQGRNLPGVERGDIQSLLVLESLPKQVNFSGGPDLVSWLGTFTLERVLGTVPVEADGSAYFEVPAGRQVFFVALDGKGLSVKRMQSFTTVMPGEVLGCAGCHEQRTQAPRNRPGTALMATQRDASQIQPFSGFPDVLDYHRDVQPILDRHCVPCHTYEKREGGVILTGDLGPEWAHGFFSLFARRQVADGRNGLGNQPPRTIGSSASPLLEKASGRHYEVKVTEREWRTLWLWIESGAPYAGSYAGLRNEGGQRAAGTAIGTILNGGHDVFQRRCAQCHAAGGGLEMGGGHLALLFQGVKNQNRIRPQKPAGSYERIVLDNDPIARFSPNILLNFSHPEKSPLLLGPLDKAAGGYGACGPVFKDAQDPDFRILLNCVADGKKLLDAEPRYATPSFKPNPQYVREMKKYGILPAGFDRQKDAIDCFEADQHYWRSLWHRPPG